jgi:solute:Na+ symporter, SSS family
MTHVNAVSFTILIVLFAVVTLVGFAAARWRRAEDMVHSSVFVVEPSKRVRLITMYPMHLKDWGLAGRGFGTFVSWFLLGGDLYTAYTFIAVPALVYGAGAAGFYALSYTIMVFPIALVFVPRLWSVARVHGYVTPADFVRGRYGSPGLGLAVAATGILATMPYIALQLVGIQSVLIVMGVGGSSSNWFIRDLPLLIAFMILATYTYLAGLRAPALIAFVKDTLIYLTVIVAIFYIPTRLGGWGHIFGTAAAHLKTINPNTGKPFGALITPPAGEWAYATLALGSALALFIYPHSVTGVFATNRRDAVKRNMAILPAYSLMLGLIALFGYMALATPAVNAGVKAHDGNTQLSVPLLFQHMFPSWFAGIGYSAVVIGALVPAAIMSIAAANLFTRNIYREFFRPHASASEETRVSRLVSLIVKAGAVVFVLALSKTFSINLQLLGGVWILQTFPSIVAGLYTRWFHRWALVLGWAAAMVYGTIEAYQTPGGGQAHFGASTAPILGHVIYIAIAAFVINLVVSVALTLAFRAARLPEGADETMAADYSADPGEAPIVAVPAPAPAAAGNGSGRHRAHRQQPTIP